MVRFLAMWLFRNQQLHTDVIESVTDGITADLPLPFLWLDECARRAGIGG